MSVFSQFFAGAAPGGAVYANTNITDPSLLPRACIDNDFVAMSYPSNRAANNLNFWEWASFGDLGIENFGDVLNTAWVADTYKTLVDVSGGGYVSNIIGPATRPEYPRSLLKYNGENGSTRCVDETGTIWAYTGNYVIDTSQSVSGGSSGYFGSGGSTGYVRINQLHNHTSFSTGAFTIATHVRFENVTGDQALISNYSASNNDSWLFYKDSSGNLALVQSDGSVSYSRAWSPSINTWYHVEVTKSGTSLRFFIDGTQVGATETDANSWGVDDLLFVGREVGRNNNMQFRGWMENTDVQKGVARHTANFTPDTNPTWTPGATTTFRITVDGVVYTFAVPATEESVGKTDSNQWDRGTRIILGYEAGHSAATYPVNSLRVPLDPATKAVISSRLYGNYYTLGTPMTYRRAQIPCLRYDDTLKVEIKLNFALNRSTYQDNRAAVIYQKDFA